MNIDFRYIALMSAKLILVVALVALHAGCAELTEQECLDSPGHTLVIAADDGGYQCRVARDQCESGFIQSKHGIGECGADSSCEYETSRCYCPPDVVCICGGGPPGRCRLKQ